MFTERRHGRTPESWSDRFGAFRRVTPWGALRLRLLPEWRLIERFVPRAARVIDAGCGIGAWAYAMRKSGRRGDGLDSSAQIIDRLRALYPDGVWQQGDVRRMTFDDAQFDALISWGVIEHD